MAVKAWIEAARLRTLPLAISTMIMGHTLAYVAGHFSWTIFIMSILTAVSLQVLSNFSNDYGDTVHGADSADRVGPKRAVQSGAISLKQMKAAVVIFAIVSLTLGLSLVIYAFEDWTRRIIFTALGLLSIWAAINYTAGSKPYGYSGKGDISVFLFFGLVTVTGSYYLQVKDIDLTILLPAYACGALSTGVLNVNNIRDIASDRKAGKMSIPAKIGKDSAKMYHLFLLTSAALALILYGVLESFGVSLKWLFVLLLPLLLLNYKAVKRHKSAEELDPYLKQLALSTAGIILIFCVGLIIG